MKMNKLITVLISLSVSLSVQAHKPITEDKINAVLKESYTMYQEQLFDVCIELSFQPSCKIIAESIDSINDNLAQFNLTDAQDVMVSSLNTIKAEAEKQSEILNRE